MLKQAFKIVVTCALAGAFSCSTPPPASVAAAGTKTDSVATNSPYTNDCKSLLETAKHMDSVLMHDLEVSKANADKAIKAFTDYSFFCKNDSIAPVFLIKASQVATSIHNLPQAQLALERCINDFPDFKNRGAAMFLLAQLYDEPQYLNDETKARQLYDNLISVYPKSE
ncbi:MAG: tetratricopeptide repeat protein, partial [Bacteroidia bacterium]